MLWGFPVVLIGFCFFYFLIVKVFFLIWKRNDSEIENGEGY